MHEDVSRFEEALERWMRFSGQLARRGMYRFSRTRGLSHAQIIVLFVLDRHGPCGVADLARKLDFTTEAH